MGSYDQLTGLAGTVARTVSAVDRDAIVRSARGVISETCDARWVSTATIMVDGTVYYAAMPLLAGDTVTNLSLFVQAAGAGVTLSKVGLYSSTGTLLASSADQGTNWQSTGLKTIALQAAYTVQTSGIYYAACVSKTGTTMPTLTRGAGTNSMVSVAVGSGALPWAGQLAQTDLPSPGTISAGVTAFSPWIAAT